MFLARRILLAACLLGGNVPLAMAGTIENGVEVSASSPRTGPESVPSQRPALATLIDFDGVAPGCVFIGAGPLRNEYAGLGVTFEGPGALNGGAILNECGFFGVTGHSSPNFVAFNVNAQMANGGIPLGPEKFVFTQEVAMVQLGVAGPAGGVATLRAYSSASILLGISVQDVTTGMHSMVVNAPGIKYATLEVVGAQPEIWVFDNLSFDTMPTPVRAVSWGSIKTTYR